MMPRWMRDTQLTRGELAALLALVILLAGIIGVIALGRGTGENLPASVDMPTADTALVTTGGVVIDTLPMRQVATATRRRRSGARKDTAKRAVKKAPVYRDPLSRPVDKVGQ
ncbi:MAG: hypothetical protein NC117_04445 [Pseudoflavonifractor sp.]|nr:hypothetical protein [Pseudoflavonifractor sp.]